MTTLESRAEGSPDRKVCGYDFRGIPAFGACMSGLPAGFCIDAHRRTRARCAGDSVYSRISASRYQRPDFSPSRILRFVLLMRFLPKRRASIDQAPGPTIAKVAPRAASIMGVHGSPEREKAIHTSTAATRVPATGVHKPTRRRVPAPAPMTCGRIGSS